MKRKWIKNVKNNVLPHTQAKLDLYKTYLKIYFSVLGNVSFVKKINIFDIFCGTGIYDDGKIGSPYPSDQLRISSGQKAFQF